MEGESKGQHAKEETRTANERSELTDGDNNKKSEAKSTGFVSLRHEWVARHATRTLTPLRWAQLVHVGDGTVMNLCEKYTNESTRCQCHRLKMRSVSSP